MAIDNTEVIDGIAYEEEKLILQLYDHWELQMKLKRIICFCFRTN